MNTPVATIALFGLIISGSALAGPQQELLSRYAQEARAATPGFSSFSASRGEAFHQARPAGGKADTPSCTSCHGPDPRQAGKSRTGKAIEPMAASSSPVRYTDPAKVEKWFKRNCDEVLGRACSPQEKGDWLTYMLAR